MWNTVRLIYIMYICLHYGYLRTCARAPHSPRRILKQQMRRKAREASPYSNLGQCLDMQELFKDFLPTQEVHEVFMPVTEQKKKQHNEVVTGPNECPRAHRESGNIWYNETAFPP